MMKVIYFVNYDENRASRNSDGVEFCIIPEVDDKKIYFYCNEYSTFWDSIGDVGNLDRTISFDVYEKIRPATLLEISNNNLIQYINMVKEYVLDTKKNIVDIKYIELK